MATNPCREAQQFNETHTVSFCGLIEVRVNGLTPIDEFFQNQYLIDTNIATPNGFSQLIPGVCRVGLKNGGNANTKCNEEGNCTRMKQPWNFTFQESGDSTEQLINVTVGVTYWQEVQVDVLENATIYQRLQVRHQVTVLVFPVTKAMTRVHMLNSRVWKIWQLKGDLLARVIELEKPGAWQLPVLINVS